MAAKMADGFLERLAVAREFAELQNLAGKHTPRDDNSRKAERT